jgi:hypothetical protein
MTDVRVSSTNMSIDISLILASLCYTIDSRNTITVLTVEPNLCRFSSSGKVMSSSIDGVGSDF